MKFAARVEGEGRGGKRFAPVLGIRLVVDDGDNVDESVVVVVENTGVDIERRSIANEDKLFLVLVEVPASNE